MKEENRKFWTKRIDNYKTNGLTTVKWVEESNTSVHKFRYYINKFKRRRQRDVLFARF